MDSGSICSSATMPMRHVQGRSDTLNDRIYVLICARRLGLVSALLVVHEHVLRYVCNPKLIVAISEYNGYKMAEAALIIIPQNIQIHGLQSP